MRKRNAIRQNRMRNPVGILVSVLLLSLFSRAAFAVEPLSPQRPVLGNGGGARLEVSRKEAVNPSPVAEGSEDPSAGAEEEGPIQDNSFLIEEAYNQEEGVVQHINAFIRFQRSKDWVYTFTQEWPVGGLKHQFSYTIPYQSIGTDGRGMGDVLLNYRYQLIGDGNAPVAFAPRFSLILPTGNEKKGLGTGAMGYQVNLPASIVLSQDLVTHLNGGITYTPSAKNALGERADTVGYNLGQSFIWLTNPTFNVMLEIAWNRLESVAGPGLRERNDALFISPGIRWAYNLKGGLQIVPGIGIPIGIGPSKGEWGVFIYLSFEHPFTSGSR